MNSAKKYAVVTGATSGIGYELARLLAHDKYNLVIVARTEEDLEHTASDLTSEFGIEVISLSKDLFDPMNAFELYDEVKELKLDIDILINDAGQGQYGEFKDTDIRRELDIINLNVSSLVVLTKLFLKDMLAKGSGRIMNLSSIASKIPGPWQSVYHGTKAFVQSFTEAIRSELKDSGVTITALLPGATATDFFSKADMMESKAVREGKLDDAEEVAKDGYRAMMNGEDMVISGFGNKMKVAMSNIMSDAAAADKLKKQQEPVETNK